MSPGPLACVGPILEFLPFMQSLSTWFLLAFLKWLSMEVISNVSQTKSAGIHTTNNVVEQDGNVETFW